MENLSRLTDEVIQTNYKKYLLKYKECVEIEHDDLSDYIILYWEKGLNVEIYINNLDVGIAYLKNEDKININIFRNKSMPDYRRYIMKYNTTIYRLKYIVSDPEHNGWLEASSIISYANLLRERGDYEEKMYYKYISDSTVGWLTNYIDNSKKAYDKTKENHENELFKLARILKTFFTLTISHIWIGTNTIFSVHEQITKDLESSIFLSLHGKYIPAISLLRKWFETLLCSIFLDVKLDCDRRSKNYVFWEKKRDAWLIGKKVLPNFSGSFGIIDEIIDSDTEFFIKNASGVDDFNKKLKMLYSDLSKYVHFGGKTEKDIIFFSEYNKDLFIEWMSYVQRIYDYTNMIVCYIFPKIIDRFNEDASNLDPIEYEPLLSDEILEYIKKYQ